MPIEAQRSFDLPGSPHLVEMAFICLAYMGSFHGDLPPHGFKRAEKLKTDPDYPRNYDIKLRHRLMAALESEGQGLVAAVRLFSPRYSPHKVPLPNAEKIAAIGKHYEDLANNSAAAASS